MARVLATLFLAGLLMVASAFCIMEANVQLHRTDLAAKLNVGVRVKAMVGNKAGHGMHLVLGMVKKKVVDVKKGAVAIVGAVKVKAQVFNVLRVELFVLNGKGESLKVKAVANFNLGVVAKLVKGARELVQEVVEGAKGDVLQLLAGDRKLVVAEIKLSLNL